MNTSGQVIYRVNSPDIFCDVLWRCDSEYTKKQHFASEIQDWDWRRRQQLFDKNLYDVDKWWEADIVFGWEKKKPLKVNCSSIGLLGQESDLYSPMTVLCNASNEVAQKKYIQDI